MTDVLSDPIAPAAFPAGRFELLPHHVWLWTDAVRAPQSLTPLPSVACLVALGGAGISIQGLMSYLRTQPRDVMFGEIVFEMPRPLAADRVYKIATKIENVERKFGRRVGDFDRVTIVQDIAADGSVDIDVRLTQVWVVSRKRGAAS